MDELKLIEYARRLPKAGPKVSLGIGDDGAILPPPDANHEWILTSDMLVEGVHFDPRVSRPQEWGKKAVHVNVSDVAAMGGLPQFMLVSIGLPKKYALSKARHILKGINDAARRWKITLVGGDTVRSEKIVIDVMMIGVIRAKRWVTRSGAKRGDVIFVSGKLGGSYESKKHLNFVPRVRESQFLVRHYRVHAMMDLSDGLAKDLRTLTKASQVGALLDERSIPLASPKLQLKNAFLDGEDFELLFCLSAKDARKLSRDKRVQAAGFHFYPIGKMEAASKGLYYMNAHQKKVPIPKAKDHHFQK